MPPEPLPLGRKDSCKEKKNDRLVSVSVGSGAKWREPSNHVSRDIVLWGSGDLLRPPADRIFEDESCKATLYRGEGKYRWDSKENKGGSLIQENSKGGKHLEPFAAPFSVSSMQLDVDVQRSVNDVLTYSSHPHSVTANARDQLHFKDQHDQTGAVNGMSTSQRSDGTGSLGSIDWRPLKWTRTGSLSSRGANFSSSNSSRGISADILEANTDLQPSNVPAVQSSSGYAIPCATPVALLEEPSSRKKHRLGWGEGLAKYEKKKVGIPHGSPRKNAGSVNSMGLNLALRSPRVSECSSPATSSSAACSSSPGMEEKHFMKAICVGNDTSNLNTSPGSVFQPPLEKHPINLENLKLNAVGNLSYTVIEGLQSGDLSLAGSNVASSAARSKLLKLKENMLKVLETTDSEIDQLENEFKLLNSNSESGCLLQAVDQTKPCLLKSCSKNIYPDTVNPEGAILKDTNAVTKDTDIDSPGTATSKLADPLESSGAYPSLLIKHSDPSELKSIEVDYSKPKGGNFAGEGLKKFTNGEIADPRSRGVTSFADGADTLFDILSYNKDAANQSFEVFNNLLPKGQCFIDISEASMSACCKNVSSIRNKFLTKKRLARFKERVASLKFRILLHLWKEDIHLVSTRKHQAKSQKKIELSSRIQNIGFQPSRSSVRSRPTSPWNSVGLNMGKGNSLGKLLVDTQLKQCRDALRMPVPILDKKEKLLSRFISSNGLVEDPCAVEKERAMINPWTPEEKETFTDKLTIFGKDFRMIATFLNHKTIADCVEFYYKNHKSDSFAKANKELEHRKRVRPLSTNTYLFSSGKNWSRELNAVSLDMLGAASVLAGQTSGMLGSGDERSASYNGSTDKEAVADVLAGIRGSRASDLMSSCITSSIDPGQSNHRSLAKRPCMRRIMQNVDDDACSDQSFGEMNSTDWTDNEKNVFLRALSSHGKDFSMISRRLRTRTREECMVFFCKARKCLGLDRACHAHGTGGVLFGDDANGSGSGSEFEDTCHLVTVSLTGINKSFDEELASPLLSAIHDESYHYKVFQDELKTEKSLPVKHEYEGSNSISDVVVDDRPRQRDDDAGCMEQSSKEAGEAPFRLDVHGSGVMDDVSLEGCRTEPGGGGGDKNECHPDGSAELDCCLNSLVISPLQEPSVLKAGDCNSAAPSYEGATNRMESIASGFEEKGDSFQFQIPKSRPLSMPREERMCKPFGGHLECFLKRCGTMEMQVPCHASKRCRDKWRSKAYERSVPNGWGKLGKNSYVNLVSQTLSPSSDHKINSGVRENCAGGCQHSKQNGFKFGRGKKWLSGNHQEQDGCRFRNAASSSVLQAETSAPFDGDVMLAMAGPGSSTKDSSGKGVAGIVVQDSCKNEGGCSVGAVDGVNVNKVAAGGMHVEG